MDIDKLCVGDVIFSIGDGGEVKNDIMFVYFGSEKVLVYLYEKRRVFWRRLTWLLKRKLRLEVSRYVDYSKEWEETLADFMKWHDYDVRAGFLYIKAMKSEGRRFQKEFPKLIPNLDDITYEEYRSRFFNLVINAQVGDFLFTSNSKGITSTIIRKVTHGPWSHCAIVGNNYTLGDMNPTGLLELPIEYYFYKKLRMGLYRHIDELTSEETEEMGDYLKQQLHQTRFPRFSYKQAIKTGIFNWMGYQDPQYLSPMDLVYGGNAKLVCYV